MERIIKISTKVINSDRFLSLSTTAQLLYFLLMEEVDKDGFTNRPLAILRLYKISSDYLDELEPDFIIWETSDPDPVTHGIRIVHWKIHKNESANKNKRLTYDYMVWKKTVKARDGNKCRKCGATEHLEAHHIKPFSKYPELRYEVSNGITLCHNCHAAYHSAERMKRKQEAL